MVWTGIAHSAGMRCRDRSSHPRADNRASLPAVIISTQLAGNRGAPRPEHEGFAAPESVLRLLAVTMRISARWPARPGAAGPSN